MRPVEIVIQTVLNEECLEFGFLVGVGGELFVAVFVDAVATLNPAVEMRASRRDSAVPYPSFAQPPLHSGQGVRLGLGQLVVDKLQAVVGLDGSELEGWRKEAGGMLEEIHRVAWIDAWIQAFVLEPGGTVDNVRVTFVTLWCFWFVVQTGELFAAGQPAAVPVVVLTPSDAVVLTGSGDAAEFLGSSKPGQTDTGSVDLQLFSRHGTIPHLHFLSSLTAVSECVQDVWWVDTCAEQLALPPR